MAEDLTIARGTKQDQYEAILPQIRGLLEGEMDLVANLANTCAALKEQFNWLWIGFYLVKEDELVLGPFQARWPAPESARAKEFVAAVGKKNKP